MWALRSCPEKWRKVEIGGGVAGSRSGGGNPGSKRLRVGLPGSLRRLSEVGLQRDGRQGTWWSVSCSTRPLSVID